MNVRSAFAGLLLLVASSGCRAPRPETTDFSGPPQPETCQKDIDCSSRRRCTDDHRCTCGDDGECAATQHCVKSADTLGGVCRFK